MYTFLRPLGFFTLLLASTIACGSAVAQCPSDDAAEPNDSCGATIPLATGITSGLVVTDVSPDTWEVVLPAGEAILVTLTHNPALADVWAVLFDQAGTCTNTEAIGFAGTFGGGNSLSFANSTGSSMALAISVLVTNGPCAEYGLEVEFMPNPFLCTGVIGDAFEPNDDCSAAVPLTVGTYDGLNVWKQGVDEDWFAIEVPPGAELYITASIGFADIDLELYDGCGGNLIEMAATPGFSESINTTNMTAAPTTVYLNSYVWQADNYSCGDYDLTIEIVLPNGNLETYCYGDGSGVACPCGNNSSPGSESGCGHSGGDGGYLYANGLPSVANNTMALQVTNTAPNSFVLLVSGANPLPQLGSCIGCGVPAFDGLRCAGGNFLRHGTRATDLTGTSVVNWLGNLYVQSTFSPGQTRNFFAFFRTDLTTGCNTGQNSTNGVRVTYLP